MALLKLLLAPVRRVLGFPLVQLAAALAVVLWLQAAESKTFLGEVSRALDLLVESTVRLVATRFELKTFTKSLLTTGFMIAYVYLAAYLSYLAVKYAIRLAAEVAGRFNIFGLTNTIARERGIAAYRAWLPLERIRPAEIEQAKWEEQFAWPADGSPPYPPLWHRALRAVVTHAAAVLIIAALLQAFTPLPALSWLRRGVTWVSGV